MPACERKPITRRRTVIVAEREEPTPITLSLSPEAAAEIVREERTAPAASENSSQTLVRYQRRARLEPPGIIGPNVEALEAVQQFTPLIDKATEFLDHAHARRTREAYNLEWALFERWCGANNVDVLPAHPATVALYVTYLATTATKDRHGNVRDARGRKPQGIRVAVAAIANEHERAGKLSPHRHPDVKRILEGIARKRAEPIDTEVCRAPGTNNGPCLRSCSHERCKLSKRTAVTPCAYCREEIGVNVDYFTFGDRVVHTACHDKLPAPQKAPLLGEHVRAMVESQEDERIGIRNKALFLLHFYGAFRRSELAALTVEQVEFCEEGLRIIIGKSSSNPHGRSKTNQRGQKRTPKVLPSDPDLSVCPVHALRMWFEESNIKAGYIFLHVDRWGNLKQRLSNHAIAVITKQWAGLTGLEPKNISGHSPRSGFATVATRKRKPLDKIMAQTGHQSADTLMGYVRDAEAFTDNAASGLLERKLPREAQPGSAE